METIKNWMPNGRQAPAAAPWAGDAGNSSQSPWWLSTAAKGVGSLAGLVAMLCGLITIFSISLNCILSGAILMTEGLIVTLIEAPCFCVFLDFAQIPGAFFDKRPHWVRATLYLGFAAVPFFSCIGFMTFMGCGLLLFTSALYLMTSLGKKASLEEMRVQAVNMSSAPTAVLVNNVQQPAFTGPLDADIGHNRKYPAGNTMVY